MRIRVDGNGFSLIEVVIATAIVTGGVVSLAHLLVVSTAASTPQKPFVV